MMRSLAIIGLVILLAAQSDVSRAQWVQTNGPLGDDVSCLAVIGNNLFAGIPWGVSVITDSGASWVNDTTGLNR